MDPCPHRTAPPPSRSSRTSSRGMPDPSRADRTTSRRWWPRPPGCDGSSSARPRTGPTTSTASARSSPSASSRRAARWRSPSRATGPTPSGSTGTRAVGTATRARRRRSGDSHASRSGCVWAHNSHLGNAAATDLALHGEHHLGQLVREAHGDAALLVGFSTCAALTRCDAPWRERGGPPATWPSAL